MLTAVEARKIATEDQRTLEVILMQIKDAAKGHNLKTELSYHVNDWIRGELERLGYEVHLWLTVYGFCCPAKAEDIKTIISWENAK